MIKLAPSILAADFANLGRDVQAISEAGCEFIHIDIMDGHFVPNITIGPGVVKALRPISTKIFDVHLMIDEPMRYIEAFVLAGADIITIHYEACSDVAKTIETIKSYNVKVGMSIKPATSVEVFEPYIKDLDMVLVMSVNPGFGGQSFMPVALEHIKRLKEMISQQQLQCDIEVDGGIYQENVEDVLKAGANVIVGGTSIFMNNEVRSNVKRYRDIFALYE